MTLESISIHPRVDGGRRVGPKINTCANSSLAKRMQRQRAGIERHLETHPRDNLSRDRVANLEAHLREVRAGRQK